MMILLVACGSKKADKYCTHCGSGMAKSDAFCSECGGAVAGDISSSSTSSVSTTITAASTTSTEATAAPTKATTKKPAPTTAKPTTAKPTTTAHKHTYSTKYVCTGCGEIDKSHAYEYLREWVKQNGKVEADVVSIREYLNGSTDNTVWVYGIYYSAQTDNIAVQVDFFDHNDLTNSFIVDIDLSSKTKKFPYWSKYGDPLGNPLEAAYGVIDGKTYTENSPISWDTYTGSENPFAKNDFFENTRKFVKDAILFLDGFLILYVPEIDIKDIGFEIFE